MLHVLMHVTGNMNRQRDRVLRLALPGLLVALTACTTLGPDHTTPEAALSATTKTKRSPPSSMMLMRRFLESSPGNFSA